MIAINATDLREGLRQLGSEEDIIGTISPREVATLIAALAIAYAAGVIAAYYLKRRLSHTVKRDHLAALILLIRAGLILIALILTVPALFNLSLNVIIIILIGAGAAIALSSQKVIANLVAGVALQYERPIGAGDFVTIGNMSGSVENVKLLSTIIRTTSGVYVRIPNDQLYTTSVMNFYARVARRYEYEIGIRYQDDAEKAIRIIAEILDLYTFVLKNPEPEIFVSDIADSSIKIKMRVWFPSVWANTHDDISLKTSVLVRVKLALEKEGIEFPYPQRVVWFADESAACSGKEYTG